MKSKRSHQSADWAASILATSFVLIGGVVTYTFVVLSSSDSPLVPLLLGAGTCLVLAMFLFIARDRRSQADARSWTNVLLAWRKPKEVRKPYRPRRRRQPAEDSDKPTENQPPTAETVRELAGGVNTWVPASRSPRRMN